MKKVGLFAYGETGGAALKGLLQKFKVEWVILPPKEIAKEQQDYIKTEKLAKKNSIPVIKTNSSKDLYELISKNPPDVVVISSYNKILPEKILPLTKFINIHHGELPRFRGRANINWTIILGRDKIGLTFHEVIPNLDAGNIYKQIMISISNEDNVKNVYEKFNHSIETHIAGVVEKVINGFSGNTQIDNPTYCCTRLPDDGYIDWTKTSKELYNLIRAVTKPYPGAFTFFEGEKMTIWESEIPENPLNYIGRIPGRVIAIHKNLGVEVLTGNSSLIIKTVSYKGREQNASEIIRSVKKTLGVNINHVVDWIKSKS